VTLGVTQERGDRLADDMESFLRADELPQGEASRLSGRLMRRGPLVPAANSGRSDADNSRYATYRHGLLTPLTALDCAQLGACSVGALHREYEYWYYWGRPKWNIISYFRGYSMIFHL